ncbi:hypothetical protein [Streptomyces sp. TR02-1]
MGYQSAEDGTGEARRRSRSGAGMPEAMRVAGRVSVGGGRLRSCVPHD